MSHFTRSAALSLCAVSLLAVGGNAQAAQKTPETKLQETLAGYTAGEPENCIQQFAIQSVQVFDKIGILYKMSGKKYFLNVPDLGLSSLDDNYVLVTDTRSSQLCNVDIVKLWDQGSRMETGFVGLGKFVPYTKNAAEE